MSDAALDPRSFRRDGRPLHPAPDPGRVSSGVAPDPAAEPAFGEFPGRPVDLHRARCLMPGLWSEVVRANFRRPVDVAYFFDCDERTARNWWEGVSAPRAEVVILAAARIPGALPHLLRVAA